MQKKKKEKKEIVDQIKIDKNRMNEKTIKKKINKKIVINTHTHKNH